MRSGAFAPDWPVVIFVAAYGGCLQIPSGLSTPLAPQAANPTGSGGCNSIAAGENRVLAFSSTILSGGGSCGARSRPAARAAFGSLRIVLHRGDFASHVGGVVGVLHSRRLGQMSVSASPHDSLPVRRVARAGLATHTAICRAPPVAPLHPVTAGIISKLLLTGAQAITAPTPRHCVCRMRPPARRHSAGNAALVSKPRPDSAAIQDFRSSSALSA